MRKLFFVFIITTLFLTACDFGGKIPSGTLIWNIVDDPRDYSEIGDVRRFWAQDISNYSYYLLDAKLLAQNEYCNVWVEMKNGVTAVDLSQAEAIADEYINIKNKLANTDTGFAANIQLENGKSYNTMQIADFMGNQDGKLCILLLDIKDGLAGTGSYVAGYFTRVNFYKDPYFSINRSNECDMIYVNTKDLDKPQAFKDTCRIVAHEMQHLMNFVTSVKVRNSSLMDLWIDEGLAGAAEWVYTEDHESGNLNSRLNSYNYDWSGLIKNGNNFFVWGNHSSNNRALLDDYATVYLFFQWLRLQKGDDIYNKIITSQYSDSRAVTSLFGNKTMGNLLAEWYEANYNNDYNNEFNNLKRHYTNRTGATISLYPGEGVFSYSADPLELPVNTGNIIYKNVNGDLFTLNTNSASGSYAEWGKITGQIYQFIGISPVRMQSELLQSELASEPARSGAISLGELGIYE